MKRLLSERMVLIVDDMPLNLLILEQILKVEGATVIKAANGKEALALLEDHPVDIILTDLQMPEMDGWEMATGIRQSNKWYRQLPIIATTAETEEAEKERCFAAGIDDMVHKPVDPSMVYQKIEAVLMRKHKNGTAVATQGTIEADFDLSYLQEVTNGDKECLLLIIDNLRKNGPVLLKQALHSVRKNEWKEVAAYLHKLKGLIALFNMQVITSMLVEAEQDAKTDNPSTTLLVEKIDFVSEHLTHSISQISSLTQS